MSDIQTIVKSINDFAAFVKQQLLSKVDVVPGKQLSTEDFTTVDKDRLAAIKTMGMHDLHISTSMPTSADGVDGDIWMVVEP